MIEYKRVCCAEQGEVSVHLLWHFVRNILVYFDRMLNILHE
jgi:hypothetical protein